MLPVYCLLFASAPPFASLPSWLTSFLAPLAHSRSLHNPLLPYMSSTASIGDERAEQVLFTLPRIDLHLPLVPITDIAEYDFNQPGRDWIVQGID